MFDRLILKGTVRENEPMCEHTSFRIGGKADYFASPSDDGELLEVLSGCLEYGIPYFVLGNGSNLLVSDNGWRGMIICMKGRKQAPLFVEKNGEAVVTVSAGSSLASAAGEVAGRGYGGFEFAAGIPGTVGGAIVMNAGAYGGEIKSCLQSVSVVMAGGHSEDLDVSQLGMSYRRSIFMQEEYSDFIITSAVFRFSKGNADEIMSKITEQLQARRQKQPLEYPSAGSVFKRPEGYYAGKLIMDSGLSGCSIGGAQVSTKHSGFIVNKGGATAADVYRLINHVAETVYGKFGVRLEPEVRLLGEF